MLKKRLLKSIVMRHAGESSFKYTRKRKNSFFCLVIAGLEGTRETTIVLTFSLFNSNCLLTALLLLIVT